MNELILKRKKSIRTEFVCDVTDKLNAFLIHKDTEEDDGERDYPRYGFYLTDMFDGWCCLRLPGATRGGIKISEDGIIIKTMLDKELLATDRFREISDENFILAEKILEECVGMKLVMPAKKINVYTCYYANIRNMTEEDRATYTLVSISKTKPNWFREKIEHKDRYCPTWLMRELIKANDPKGKQFYMEMLDRIGITDKFEENTIFLCHEANSIDCHRSVFSEKLNREGYNCGEIHFSRK